MTNLIERIFARHDIHEVRAAWIARALREAHRISPAAWMAERGYERVDVADGVLMTDDGREVLRLDGQPWSLRPEVHAARVRAAMDAATARAVVSKLATAEPVAETPAATTCPRLIDGQLCGGDLKRASVCPRCDLGRHGVVATLTCDVCGAVTAVMRQK